MERDDAGAGLRRLPIQAGAARVDVVLPAGAPVATLIPAIVDVVAVNSDFEPGPAAVRYQLGMPGTPAMDMSKSLVQLGIREGTILVLTHSSAEFTPPRSDDAAEAVGAVLTTVAGTSARRIGALISSCFAAVSAMTLLRIALAGDGAHRTGCVGVAAASGLLCLAGAAAAYRVFTEDDAGVALGLAAVGFCALAGLLAVPGSPGAPHGLLAAAAAATSATAVRGISCQSALFTALACFSMTGVVAMMVGVLTSTPFSAIGVGLAATSVALLEAAPRASVSLSRMTVDDPTGAARARRWLTALVAAFSAAAALGAVSAAVSTTGSLFAALIGGILLLRSRVHSDIRTSAPLMICGAVALGAALLGFASTHPQQTWQMAALSTALSFVPLYLGFAGAAMEVTLAWRRGVELLEYLAFAAVVPLTFWLCGVFGAVRGFSLL